MRTKKVSRHYCDHCSKGMFQRPAMVKHETGCTANPDRVCGVCSMAQLGSKPLAELKAFLKERADWDIGFDQKEFGALDKATIAELRTMADGCPACMFAAMRQLNCYGEERFDLKAEMQAVWSIVNEAERVGYAY